MGINRRAVYEKYGGRCAYCGKPLGDDWQVDHIFPKHLAHMLGSDVMKKYFKITLSDINQIENLIPCQKILNHYKRGLVLEDFRNKWLGGLHKRLSKLPRNPRTEKSKKRKEYMLKIASFFDISPDKPFNGVFYFERRQK